MNTRLQFTMITASFIFLVYMMIMIRNKRVELKYALAWLFAGIFLLAFAVFPGLLGTASALLNIAEPVNTIFLLVIFFLMLILFSLTAALSRSSSRIRKLIQEVGIIKLELEKLRRNTSK
jgi:hypothetical protein